MDILRTCPHHGLILENFDKGLNANTRNTMENIVARSSMKKEPEEAYNPLDDLATINLEFPLERIPLRRTVGGHEINCISALQVQVDVLTRRLDKFITNSINFVAQVYENYASNHDSNDGLFSLQAEQVNYAGN